MEIIKLKIEELKPYKNNAKIHTAEQIEQIKKSIEEFGFNDPIAIWGKDNLIIEGHGRLEAIKQLDYKEVECIRLDHLTDEERRAYTLAHNKLTMNTDFDLEMLNVELDDILNIDMQDFGFELEKEPDEVVEDDFEIELPDEPKAKLGDIYQLGNHRLMCGDSTLEEDVEKLTEGKEMDLCLTDPPYNVNYGDKAEMLEDYDKGHRNVDKILNDNMSDSSFYQFLFDFYKQMLRVLRKGGAYYIFHSDSEGYNFRKALRDNDNSIRQTIIWVKNCLVLGRQDYQWKHEPILYGWKDGGTHYFTSNRTNETVIEDRININKMTKEEMKKILKEIYSDKTETTILHEDKPTRNDVHPTMKPLKLCGRLVNNSTEEEQYVIDFFGGSGSTMMACEQLNRVCYTMELDPKYIDVIINRWETFTGKKAIKIGEIK